MNRLNLLHVKRQHARRIIQQYDGVVGVGVSEKEVEGSKVGRLALTVYVQHKVKAGAIAQDQRIDMDTALLDALEHRADLDIKQLPEIRALNMWPMPPDLSDIRRTDGVAMAWVDAQARRGIYRPVFTGASEGHFSITTGTGSVLVRRGVGTVLRLSNNHVYAAENAADIDDPIYQPGPFDGGVSGNTVGKLFDFVPLSFNYVQEVNVVDAAVRTVDGEEYQDVIGLNVAPQLRGVAEIGMRVVKSGRTTEVTGGVVADVDASIFVGYSGDRQGLFEDQIIVESEGTFSQGGDSGSAVFLEAEGLPWVGLLFAGDEQGRITVCNHAYHVENALAVELLTDGATPPVPPPDDDKPGCNPFRRGG